MTPHRVQVFPLADAAAVVGAATLGSVLLDLVAPTNLILLAFFFLALFTNWVSGILKAWALHRRSGSKAKWFSVSHAVFGFAKKLALILFVPIAGVMDGTLMLMSWSEPVAQHTPTVKAVLVAINGALCIGAARSLHVVIGDDAFPALAVILRAVDSANTGGRVPQNRATDPIIEAHLRQDGEA